MRLKQLSESSGIEMSELVKRCLMFGINKDCYVTKDNIRALTNFIKQEPKERFLIIPSKMNE